MSSQTSISSGKMSKTVTKAVLLIGEKAGIMQHGAHRSASIIEKYNIIIRNIAHVSMYFVLACVLCFLFWITKLNKFKASVITLGIGFICSVLDEINQMNFIGRNSNGVLLDAIEDIERDTIGICIALLIFLLIRILSESRKRNLSH